MHGDRFYSVGFNHTQMEKKKNRTQLLISWAFNHRLPLCTYVTPIIISMNKILILRIQKRLDLRVHGYICSHKNYTVPLPNVFTDISMF